MALISSSKEYRQDCPFCICRTIVLLDLKSQKTVGEPLFTVPEEHGVDKMRFNDGKAAPGGALIIGRMHSDWRKGTPGRLYM